MFACLHKDNRNIVFNFNALILFCHKRSVQLSIYSLVSLVPCKVFFSTKFFFNIQFNVNYSNTRVFTFDLYNCQETKSNRCNQIEVLLQMEYWIQAWLRFFRPKEFQTNNVIRPTLFAAWCSSFSYSVLAVFNSFSCNERWEHMIYLVAHY